MSTDEALREVPALLLFHDEPSLGQQKIVFERGAARAQSHSLTIERRDLGVFGELLAAATQPALFRFDIGFLVLMMAAMTAWTEAHACRLLQVGGAAFATAVLARAGMLMAIAMLDAPILYLLVVLIILVPWLALARAAFANKVEAVFYWVGMHTESLAKICSRLSERATVPTVFFYG
jgi:hypothetical protein